MPTHAVHDSHALTTSKTLWAGIAARNAMIATGKRPELILIASRMQIEQDANHVSSTWIRIPAKFSTTDFCVCLGHDVCPLQRDTASGQTVRYDGFVWPAE